MIHICIQIKEVTILIVVLEPACVAGVGVRLYVKVRGIKEIHARSLS
jgi:hypothetical protein